MGAGRTLEVLRAVPAGDALDLGEGGEAIPLTDLLNWYDSRPGGPDNGLSFILTNGRSMYALRHGAPMTYVERQGLHEPPDDYTPPPTGSTQLRYVMVVSGVDEDPVGYETVPERAVGVIDRGLDVTVHAL